MAGVRTATRYATAVSTCARVLYVNRMILYVTCTLGFFCILITAALIYQVSNKDDREENEIHDNFVDTSKAELSAHFIEVVRGAVPLPVATAKQLRHLLLTEVYDESQLR